MKPSNPLTLLIDVGGTKSRFVLQNSLQETTRSHSFATAWPLSPHSLKKPLHKFLKNVRVHQIYAGIRGVWLPAEKMPWVDLFRDWSSRVSVMSDVELAHWLAFGSQPGILLVAGTGSICLGRSAAGKLVRSGGLGPLIGDDGSSFWIGREYLKRVFLAQNNWKKVRQLVTHTNAISQIARLSQRVLKKANSSPHSLEAKIVREASELLLKLVDQVRERLGDSKKELEVALQGGLFESPAFKKLFLKSSAL